MSSFKWPPAGGNAGTITEIDTNHGVTGGPITTSGTISLADIADQTVLGNVSGGTTFPIALSKTQLTTLVNAFSSSLSGAAPASGGGTANFLRADGSWAVPPGATSGTVTSVSVVSANGFAGTVATATTTPAITLSTSISGILSGNGTAISAASTTGSGSVVLATAPTMTSPVVGTQSQGDASTKAASTAYVDTAIANALAGVNPAVAVQAATTAAGDTSGFTYNNGVSGVGATFTGSINTAVTIDGYTFTALGQRLLVKNDTQSPSGAFNGVYYVTQVQTGILPPILTRALDYNTPSDMNNTGAIPVINGTTNGTTSWVLTSLVVTVGTTPLTFTKFTRNPADYLLVANNLSDVNSASTSRSNLGLSNVLTGLTGDGTAAASGVGTAALTLASVASAGTTGSSTSIPAITIDVKGRVTSVSGNVVIAPAGTLTGTTLAANVVTSSLTSVGTIATGVWNGTAVDVAHGGTGNTTFTAYSVVCAGTTATGVFQNVSGVGTSGQVLTSNGASALPTWQGAAATTTIAMLAQAVPTGTITASTLSDAIIGTVIFDTNSAYNNATGVYTIPTTGYYRIDASLNVEGTTAAGKFCIIQLTKNTSTILARSLVWCVSTEGEAFPQLHITASFTATDTLRLQILTNITSPTFAGGNSPYSFFSILNVH